MIPSQYTLLYSAEQIAKRVAELGAEIGIWADSVRRKTSKSVIATPILRGGMIFCSDIVRAVECSVEIADARSISYLPGKNAVPLDEVKVNIQNVRADGRAILVIDDICDSGATLASFRDNLLDAGAIDVRSVVLIRRLLQHETFKPDWTAFSFPGEQWLVGYGMDDADEYRNLACVYTIGQGGGR